MLTKSAIMWCAGILNFLEHLMMRILFQNAFCHALHYTLKKILHNTQIYIHTYTRRRSKMNMKEGKRQSFFFLSIFPSSSSVIFFISLFWGYITLFFSHTNNVDVLFTFFFSLSYIASWRKKIFIFFFCNSWFIFQQDCLIYFPLYTHSLKLKHEKVLLFFSRRT